MKKTVINKINKFISSLEEMEAYLSAEIEHLNEKYSNMSEKLQDGERGQLITAITEDMEAAASSLVEAKDYLENCIRY